MPRAIVVLGGPIAESGNPRWTHPVVPREGDIVICADSGAERARRLGLVPSVILGDLDSIPSDLLAEADVEGIPVIKYPVDKDHTDAELAMAHAEESSAENVLVLATSTGQQSHWIGALAAAGASAERQPQQRWEVRTSDTRFRWATTGSVLELTLDPHQEFSVLPDTDSMVISIEGGQWNLAQERIERGSCRGVHNRCLGEVVRVTSHAGRALVVTP